MKICNEGPLDHINTSILGVITTSILKLNIRMTGVQNYQTLCYNLMLNDFVLEMGMKLVT